MLKAVPCCTYSTIPATRLPIGRPADSA